MTLPVAGSGTARSAVVEIGRRHRRPLVLALTLHALAAVAGLVGPRLLGELVDAVRAGTTTVTIDRIAVIFAVVLLVQTGLTRWARLRSATLAEQVLAELREDFLRRVVALPLGTVESASTGDLLTRATSDVDRLQYALRRAAPEVLVAAVTVVLTVIAMVLAGPLLAMAWLAALPLLVLSTRWYLRRAPDGYTREMAAWAQVNAGFHETVDGAATVEALRLTQRRVRRTDDDLAKAYGAERYTLWLRTRWFPCVEVSYFVPIVSALLLGGALFAAGVVSLGQVVAVTLYAQQLVEPVDQLISWLDELQVGAASLARVLGVRAVGAAGSKGGLGAQVREPADERLVAAGVRFAYTPGRDVLHDVDLDVRPGERVALVGPSGAGKSTLGRLLAGVHAPRTGSVKLGGVDVTALPLETLRRHVVLVNQEQHVFVGTLGENVALAAPSATDDEVRAALAAVDALGWALALPDGLDTRVGSGGLTLSPGQAQQLALARIVLADPHTLVLDEATSSLDPGAARHLERSLAAVLEGRTVVAIAHRLHTAYDADCVAVVEDGRIVELGPHEQLVDGGGRYAALWRSWHDDP